MITRLKNGLYDVPSATSDHAYQCDPRALTCTCPDFHYRRREEPVESEARRCRHLCELENYLTEQSELARMTERAAHLSDEDLYRFARARQGDAVGAACLLELACRKAAAEREAKLRELFR